MIAEMFSSWEYLAAVPESDALGDAGVIAYRSDWEASGPRNEQLLFAQPEFRELDAVRAGRLVALPDFLPQGYGDALALLGRLEAGLRRFGRSI